MRFLLSALVVFGSVTAGESAFPLWDNVESVADYAKKANLPPTKTLDLGYGVTMELVLIPAGKFIMGTPEPAPVDEESFNKKILIGQSLLAASAGALLVMLAVVVLRAIRKKHRPQMSLGRLTLVTVATGGCVLSGLDWRQSAQALELAKSEYTAARSQFQSTEENAKPAHPVTLTQPVYMGKFTVTQEQYERVTGANPSQFKGRDNPVEMISWEDVQAFCKKLTEQTKEGVRVPTEAEWEFACRAGTRSTYYSGDTEADLARVAWYLDNSKHTTHPVGQKEPNAFGLYDMHGNVWQWCQDWMAFGYSQSPSENPQGPAHGPYRLLRGGSKGYAPMGCRSDYRYGVDPGDGDSYNFGFRVVVAPAPKTP